MKIECVCGCVISINATFKLSKDPGAPIIPLKCPNCGKEIMMIAVDMGEQNPIIENKKTKKIELSFKEES